MKKLSIVGKDYHAEEHVLGYYNTGDRIKYWGKLGAFWGRILGSSIRIRLLFCLRYRAPCCGWPTGVVDGAGVVGGLIAVGEGGNRQPSG